VDENKALVMEQFVKYMQQKFEEELRTRNQATYKS
jgi:hypothetical protein